MDISPVLFSKQLLPIKTDLKEQKHSHFCEPLSCGEDNWLKKEKNTENIIDCRFPKVWWGVNKSLLKINNTRHNMHSSLHLGMFLIRTMLDNSSSNEI